ncbi:MAG: MoxR family ATPase [Calditrichaeota bacterium]|nr:MoxR family ATPase [Calditrichota bacterium]
MGTSADIQEIQSTCNRLKDEIAKVIVGQEEIIEKIIIAMLANGHCLLVGVPGLAKTLTISSLAKALGADFKRIQFTPDLMPSDILGTEILNVDDAGQKKFKFMKGPVFTNVLLADEINRTPPKTQAALLEAMQEKNVTIGGNDYQLDAPFFVLATQNPIEQEGTYPLPEAQLDRFMFQLKLDYPTFEDEVRIVERTILGELEDVSSLNLRSKILDFQKTIRSISVEKNVVEFAVNLVRQTRASQDNEFTEIIRYGAGPRASQYLILGAKIMAVLRGDTLADREHVKELAPSVLGHRILLSFSGEADGWTIEKLVDRIVQKLA